jgi:three-Cys-motif partner protein
VNSLPSLIFIDPFGYKGVTKHLIDECLRQWGSDLILFFNFNRVNAAITNPAMKTHVDLLFDTERANRLRLLVLGMDPRAREKLVIQEFAAVAKGAANAHVLPFRFSSSVNAKTSTTCSSSRGTNSV